MEPLTMFIVVRKDLAKVLAMNTYKPRPLYWHALFNLETPMANWQVKKYLRENQFQVF